MKDSLFKSRSVSMNDPTKIIVSSIEKGMLGDGGSASKRMKIEGNEGKESLKKLILDAEHCMNNKSSVMPSSQNPNNSLSFGNNDSDKTPTNNDHEGDKKPVPQFHGSQMSNGGRILPLPSPNKLSIGANQQKFQSGTNDSVVQIMQELQANQKREPTMNLLTPSTIGQHKGQVFFEQGITPPIFKGANSVGK